MKNLLFWLLFFYLPCTVGVLGSCLLMHNGVRNGLEILPVYTVVMGLCIYGLIPWDATLWWDRKWQEWNGSSK